MLREILETINEDGLDTKLQDLAQMAPKITFNYSDINKRNKKNDKKITKLLKDLKKTFDFDIDDEDTFDIQTQINSLVLNKED